MVHDAIAYAPYELRFINQTYTAYELSESLNYPYLNHLSQEQEHIFFLRWQQSEVIIGVRVTLITVVSSHINFTLTPIII